MPRFRIDSARSTIDIDLKVNLHASHIRATGLTGSIECELDAHGRPRLDRPYSGRFSLPVNSIKSGNTLQDLEMRRRLDASRYPRISAQVTDGALIDEKLGRYRATAKLTIHGRTREIEGEVRLRVEGGAIIADGKQVINMKDFDIDPPNLIILRVDPELLIRAHVVADEG